MPVRLSWHVGTSGEDIAARPPATGPTRRRGARGALKPVLVGVYLVALVVTGSLGFNLGRQVDVSAGYREAIESQLGVESLARREGDDRLYASTLDPDAPREWGRAQRERFREAAGEGRAEVELGHIELLSSERARVTVIVKTAAGRRTETRTYRAVGRSWVLTP